MFSMRNITALFAFVAFTTSCLLMGPTPLSAQEADSTPYLSFPETDDGLPGEGPIRRYDWFRNLWKQRRTAWVQSAANDQKGVVFFGDSITQGWGDKLSKEYPDLKSVNRGISGDTTRGMLIRLTDDVLKLNPQAIVMLMGTNDLEEGADPEVIASNVKLILTEIQTQKPEVPVILNLVFPSSASKKRPKEKIQPLNASLIQLAKEFPQVTVLDTWLLFANAEGDARLEEFPDLLHPNDAGYAKWAKALRPLLATAGLIEKDDPWQPEAGYRSLFNGKDLSGWAMSDPKSQAIVQSFDGKTQSDDGRYRAINGRLVVTTPQEGRRIQALWTEQEFPGDFELRLDFRATPNADSGVFLRKPQLQCRDYLLAGPYKQLKNYRPQEWNQLVVIVKENVAYCTCNGEVLEATFALPETGPIGLEGDKGQMEYRHIQWKPLNSK